MCVPFWQAVTCEMMISCSIFHNLHLFIYFASHLIVFGLHNVHALTEVTSTKLNYHNLSFRRL